MSAKGMHVNGWGGFVRFPEGKRPTATGSRDIEPVAVGYNDDELFPGRVSSFAIMHVTDNSMLGASPFEMRAELRKRRR